MVDVLWCASPLVEEMSTVFVHGTFVGHNLHNPKTVPVWHWFQRPSPCCLLDMAMCRDCSKWESTPNNAETACRPTNSDATMQSIGRRFRFTTPKNVSLLRGDGCQHVHSEGSGQFNVPMFVKKSDATGMFLVIIFAVRRPGCSSMSQGLELLENPREVKISKAVLQKRHDVWCFGILLTQFLGDIHSLGHDLSTGPIQAEFFHCHRFGQSSYCRILEMSIPEV